MSAPLRAAALAGPARLLCAALLVALPLARPSHASTEEFSTFDVERPEEDDESLLDHALTATPRAWAEEWRRAPMALRTAQGCLTSGQWLIETDLRVGTALGRRARFGVEVDQSETDFASWNQMDLTFRFPGRFGTPGALFRPYFDKSRQDLGLTWETGADSAGSVLAAAFTIEDMFNNLWAWRQTRVGNASEPYERHPYEPALRWGVRRERWSAGIGGKYLTPSRKRDAGPEWSRRLQRETLWGTLGDARLEVEAAGLLWEALGANKQAASTSTAIPDPAYGGPYTLADSVAFVAGDDRLFRRLWSAGLGARRAAGRWSVELSWLYQERTQTWAPPTGSGRFDAIDRMLRVEVARRFTPALEARAGALRDRVSVAESGVTPGRGYGSRYETRAYLGLDARFGSVRVFGVEGLELDDEPYDVWWIHDKGFFGLQATF